MRLHRVRLRNYRGVTESDVSFSTSGVTIVEGQNEVGKTSIPEAVQLAIEFPDSSQHARVKSAKPVDRDQGPEVEIALSSGPYDLVYRKRWLRTPETVLEVRTPRSENLTGRDAHDRVKAILEETLDEDLWRALRIEQGTELSLPLFDLPSVARALDRAAGGDLATDREDTLWSRIGEEYDKYWTPKGQAKGDRKSSEHGVENARDEVQKLEERLGDIESDAAELSRLIADETRLAATQTEYHQRESELTERWGSAQSLRSEVQRLTAVCAAAGAEREHAAGEQHRRRELIDTLHSRSEALAQLEAQAEQAAPALAAATRHSEQAQVALESARAALRSVEGQQRLASDDRDYLRQKIEVAQLTERHARYVAAANALRAAEDLLESARVDDDLAHEIEEAYLEDVRAKAAADSAAASVETTALCDITVHINGEQVALASSETKRTLVDDVTVLVIPDAASIRVRAGPESRELADHRTSTQEALRRLCDRGGVADLSEARTAAQGRREALRDREEARKTIKQDLRDLTPEILLDKIEGLSARVASYSQMRPDNPPIPSNFEDAKRLADEMERLVTDCKAERGASEDAAEKARGLLRQAQERENVLAARIDDARTSRDGAATRLATARQDRSDEALTRLLVVAAQRVDAGQKSLEQGEAELSAADPDSLDALLENAREATQRATEEWQSNKERRHELRIRLDFLGEEGLHTRHDEAFNRLRHVEREHERSEARAQAVRLLKETFEKRRAEARQRYVEPFKARIDQLGRIVFGPRFAVELDDELQLVRRTLNGITLDIDQLSTGAREQLGVLSRLACAAIVSPDDGGAPVMIDDALGWSDPQRLQNMGAAIAAAGKQCQVVVLTCTPGRYSHVGNAKVITLGT